MNEWVLKKWENCKNQIVAINVYGSCQRWRTRLTTYIIIDISVMRTTAKQSSHKHSRHNHFQFTDQILTLNGLNVIFISNRLTFNKSVKISCVSFHINQSNFFPIRFVQSTQTQIKNDTTHCVAIDYIMRHLSVETWGFALTHSHSHTRSVFNLHAE